MIKTSIIAATLVLLTLVVSPSGAEPRPEDPQCGAAVDGLRMCLASKDGASLQLALMNVGDHDLTLNLGIMLGNSKVQLPDRVALKFTDAAGKTRVFKFGDPKHGFVAGRVDHYIVPLRVGSTYTLQLTLDQFWCDETKEFSIPLLSGENYLTAQFEGTAPTEVNTGMSCVTLFNFWVGKVESNSLTLRR
jgi:hypothetical protein